MLDFALPRSPSLHLPSPLANWSLSWIHISASQRTCCKLCRPWTLRRRTMSSVHRSFGRACLRWALRLRPEKCSSGSHGNICLDHQLKSWLVTLCVKLQFNSLAQSPFKRALPAILSRIHWKLPHCKEAILHVRGKYYYELGIHLDLDLYEI